jgi:hypothetical protein
MQIPDSRPQDRNEVVQVVAGSIGSAPTSKSSGDKKVEADDRSANCERGTRQIISSDNGDYRR